MNKTPLPIATRAPTYGFIAALAVLCTIGALGYRNTRTLDGSFEWVEHTHAVLARLANVDMGLLAAENARRGFALTGDESMRASVTDAMTGVGAALAEVKALTADNPIQLARLAGVEALCNDRKDIFALALLTERADVAAQKSVTLRGETTSRALREAVGVLGTEERNLLDARLGEARGRSARMTVSLFASTLGAILALAAAFAILRREMLVRAQGENALRAVNAELEAFSYSVSHDLRSPLRSIDGFSQALIEDNAPQLDESGRGYLARIRAATQRMGQLIDDLLELSRITRLELRRGRVDLSAIARSVVDDLRKGDPDRDVEVVVASALMVDGDAELLRIAMENLLRNAWKFTSKVAHARVEVGSRREADGKETYFVKDNGAGFDMAHASKLFGAFQRLHGMAEFPGTGIGLATVRRIMNRHAGRVWAEAETGAGATFFLAL